MNSACPSTLTAKSTLLRSSDMGRTLIVNLGWLMIIRVCTSLMHFLSTTSASSTLMLRTKTPGQGKMIHEGGNTHERSDKD